MCDNCKCRDIIGGVTGIIQPLVRIVFDYASVFTIDSYNDYIRNNRFIGADENGRNLKLIKSYDIRINNVIIFELKQPTAFLSPIVKIVHRDYECRYSCEFIAYRNSGWNIDIHNILCISKREIIWNSFRSGVPMPSEFSYACDYLLRDIDEWLKLKPRKMVCSHGYI